MSHTAVRRAAMLSLAVNVFCLMAVLLVATVIRPQAPEEVSTVPEGIEEKPICLPMKMECTSLVVETMAIYDGPFYEDGSGKEVMNVAAVIVYNDSDHLIPYANITVDTENGCLTFQAYMLPPQSYTLVPEAAAQPYLPGEIKNIYAWHTVRQENGKEDILITHADDVTLQIQNCSGRQLNNLKVCFKKFTDGVYIGGKPFEFTVPVLAQNESVRLSPRYYVQGYSRIVFYEETIIPPYRP